MKTSSHSQAASQKKLVLKRHLPLKYNQLLARGSEVFGSSESFQQWLRKPAFGLDGDIPRSLLITSEGINLVYDEVERIANGEFA